jgi:transcriptional regulator with XRE-family HTH domain
LSEFSDTILIADVFYKELTVIPEALYILVGQQIRKVRKERGLTQEQLATLVSLTRTSITNIEHGRQKLLLHTLYEIANALAIEPHALLPPPNKLLGAQGIDQDIPADLSSDEQEWIRSIVTTSTKGG